MTSPVKSRANDISRILNKRGFGEHLAVPPAAHGNATLIIISSGYAHAVMDTLYRLGYTVRESGASDQRYPNYVSLAVMPTRRAVSSRRPAAPQQRAQAPTGRLTPAQLQSYLPQPVTSLPGEWVDVTAADAKEVNMITWQKCSFQVSTALDRETGKVTTSFPTGYRDGMAHFMKMHGYEGEILPGHIPEVSRAVWSRRFVPTKNG